MSLEPNFTIPENSISEAETKKRNQLIEWFSNYIDEAIVAMIVSGSMGYGFDYSVKETSDIDMQLVVTPQTVKRLKNLEVFNKSKLEKAIDGYLAGKYGQFSLVFAKDGVNLECHFWDLNDLIDAITYRTANTKRLRSGVETPSTDHGFSFDRDESIKDYYGEMVDEYPVGIFPSYRIENDKIYLCRPITNILGLPRFEKTRPELEVAVEKCWNETVQKLNQFCKNATIDLGKYNIENVLPGKNKMRQDVLNRVRQKTREKIKQNNLDFIN